MLAMLANDITVQWYWIAIQFFYRWFFIHISCLSERSTPLANFIAILSHCYPPLEMLANHNEIISDQLSRQCARGNWSVADFG